MKRDFPLLSSDIVYLDSAATSQKPKVVIDAMDEFYQKYNANADRGAYGLAMETTEIENSSREVVREFINARDVSEIIFTKNATEASNLIAYAYGLDNLSCDDEIVISIMEHHSNLVPWQYVAKKCGCKIKYLYLDSDCQIPSSELLKINDKTKMVCITHVSNVLGAKNDIKTIIDAAHEVGAKVVVDASQSVAHESIDVQDLDCDFLFFSGHKMYGPLGVGVLYAKSEMLNLMNPFMMGGGSVLYVYEDNTTFKNAPYKFESGTQNVAASYGLASAIKYINGIGFESIKKHDEEIMEYAISELSKLDFVKLYLPKEHVSVVSFNVVNVHAHDVMSILDMDKICLRAGNHCAQPLMRYLGIESTCRASFGIYTEKSDIDKLVNSLLKVKEVFGKVIDSE